MKHVSGILTLLIFSICKADSVKSGRSGGKMYFGESSRGVSPKNSFSVQVSIFAMAHLEDH